MFRIIKSNRFLFQLWYHLYRKNRGLKINYFSSKTFFLLDGYPRSGNTFFAGLCKTFFGEESFIHHFHTIAPIKIALRKRLPVFILIRKPEEAISSYYLKTFALSKKNLPEKLNIRLLKETVDNYIEYYKYVYSIKDKIHLIVFEDNIRTPYKIISSINEIVYQGKYEIDIDTVENFKIQYKGATDVLGSSRPNAVKENFKEDIKNVLTPLKAFDEATNLYNKIVKK